MPLLVATHTTARTLDLLRQRTVSAAHKTPEVGLSFASVRRGRVVEAVRTDRVPRTGVVVSCAYRQYLQNHTSE